MRRSIIHYTAIVLAGPGIVGLLFSLVLLVALISGLANASQGGTAEGPFGIVMVGMAGVLTVGGCFMFSMSLFFASCLLWGMELLLERAEKRDRLLNQQITAIFELQKLMSPYEE